MRKTSFTFGTIVLLWTLFVSVLCTPDVGIQKDWFNGDHGDLVSFSAVLLFEAKSDKDSTNPLSELSDGQLVGLCAKAFDEMRSAGGSYQTPRAMALLAVDHKVYLASSIVADRNNWLGRGKGTDEQRPQILARAAGAARIAGSSHRIGGACGEINIMDLYQTHNKNLNLSGKKARIVVWATTGGPPTIFNPCATPAGGYGCGDFLRAIANPSNPTQPLNDDTLKVIPNKTNRDDNWPDGAKFSYIPHRQTEADKESCEMMIDIPFDPNNPDQ